MKKLRLLLFENCNRSCEGCCNKQWDLKTLPVCTDFRGYECIMMTGGEPMLRPDLVLRTATKIHNEVYSPTIYMYTSKVDSLKAMMNVMPILDGITVTLHEQEDVEPFKEFNDKIVQFWDTDYSFRLNVFKGVSLNETWIDYRWKVKLGIEWIDPCPLPDNEVFMRL